VNRRSFMRLTLGGAAAAGLPTLTGCKFSFEQGVYNACKTALPPHLANHPLVLAAWNGVDASEVWDCHAHLFGNGRSGPGIWVSPDFDAGNTMGAKVRRAMFANGGCLGDDEALWDRRMVERIVHLLDALPVGAKAVMLAFDFTYGEKGDQRQYLTTFSVSNRYAARIAAMRPDRLEWACSVHPYREDAIEELKWCKAHGARAVKWLPPTMDIDLASPRCVPFYDALRELNLPLLTHVGQEMSVQGAHREDLGHPLALRHPLDRGVRVIAAHCASLGASPDWDALPKNATVERPPMVENFRLFARLMNEPRYEKLLFGDISATILYNRADYIGEILANKAWHERLLNGSDYPLPGIMPVVSIDHFVRMGLLREEDVPVLRELRQHNPLLFDFVLKRSLKAGGAGFAPRVFETRRFFRET
jgi:uncharacterized protein